MKTISKILFFLFFTTLSSGLFSQQHQHLLFEIEKELMNGNKKALFDIAAYFGSNTYLTEYDLDNREIAVTENRVAKRIIEENCFFLESEFIIDEKNTAKEFSDFLNTYYKKIHFSTLADAFIITPLEKREVNVEFREISEYKKEELRKKLQYFDTTEWVKKAGIDKLIKKKKPMCLLLIASEFFKNRYRNYYYCDYQNEYMELLQSLTNIEIGTENEENEIIWNIYRGFWTTPTLNLLIYFSKHYLDYQWNEEKKIFENTKIQIKPIEKEVVLFQLLNHENDSIAMNAFLQLTTCNPIKIIQLAKEYQLAGIETSYAIPRDSYAFLKQLVFFTEYCNLNEIDFQGSTELNSSIDSLQLKLPFSQRRKLEDNLINNLTLEEITAFEYWAVIYANSWELSYSAGRILDIFYSKNWTTLLENEKQLHWYLKKSVLLDDLGITGVCNNYLRKFANSSPTILTHLKNIQTSDNDIKEQIQKIISGNIFGNSKPKSRRLSWEGNMDYEVENLEEQLNSLIKETESSDETDKAISKLLSRISYEQIAIALSLIENYSFKIQWKKYSFMERDWGFFMVGSFDDEEIRKEFLNHYSRLSEYELYTYYLDKAELDYKDSSDNLDYDKIYRALKYNVTGAFVGGGNYRKDNEVYPLIKLLELTFNTRHGFPKKLCNSNNIYGCSSDLRAKAWMQYLIDNQLLKQKHNEPISFNDFD